MKYENVEDEQNEKDDDNEDEIVQNNMSWKENLAQKAKDAYLERQSNSTNLMKIVYGVFSAVSNKVLDIIDKFKHSQSILNIINQCILYLLEQ